MAKKRKGELPSGNIRIKLYIGMDDKGHSRYKSFTAPTRAQAKALAADWKANKMNKSPLTVIQACERYVELKESVLSPATIRGYMFNIKKIRESDLGAMPIASITAADVQLFVSDLSRIVAPKTVANTYGLLSAVAAVFAPEVKFAVTLPKKKMYRRYIPSVEDVQQLLDAIDDIDLKLAVLFAAVGTMRRGEACAVTFDDVDLDNNTISINKSLVEDMYHEWFVKEPKTYESNRVIRMPGYVMDIIRSLDRDRKTVLNMTPPALYMRFRKAVVKAGLPHFTYHDLRHYAASQMHASGVPERYIEAMGGWRPGSNVLKQTYENIIDLEMERVERAYLDRAVFRV